VFGWMRSADEPPSPPASARQGPPPPLAPARHGSPPPSATARPAPQPSRRFVVLAVVFVLLFLAASPLYLESRTVFALAAFVARAAAAILVVVGVGAHAASNVLWTPRGGFLVTQECVSTPLIPIYLAAVCTYATTWRRAILGVAATLPLFIALGIMRLLVVALPGVVASPLFFVHAFYQLLLGAVVVFLAALWRHGGRTALGYTLGGVVVGVLFVHLLGPFYTRVMTFRGGAALDDPQGAIDFLPAFQVGLYLALWVAAFVAVGWRRFVGGFALLGLTQAAGLLVLHALTTHPGLGAHVRDVRGWAVAGPVLIFGAVVNVARPHR
jgi:hypothetical protein